MNLFVRGDDRQSAELGGGCSAQGKRGRYKWSPHVTLGVDAAAANHGTRVIFLRADLIGRLPTA
jgi:hypothetical protein